MENLYWSKLLTNVRRKALASGEPTPPITGSRTQSERDFDRVLFSTPVRRLADKTQVFPLEKHDSVRTRLTHSYEVSNLARSMGIALCYESNLFKDIQDAERLIPPMLAAIGLAHDIGNPPFGHQGELSIGSWFKKNEAKVFGRSLRITKQMRQDYLRFEGNAQALRIMTRLQILNDKFGLNLTCGTLAALMKYPCGSHETNKKIKVRKKFGYFYSEEEISTVIWEQTGLAKGVRHPLTYVMEAADDIAYSVLDAEDSVKKFLVSYRDLIAYLRAHDDDDPVILSVVGKAESEHEKYKGQNLCPSELNDLSMQMFRVFAIDALISGATQSFATNYSSICNGTFAGDLIESSSGSALCQNLKDFSFKHAYRHKTVLELELQGHKVIHSIMDLLWPAIVSRGDPQVQKEHMGDPFEKYAYGRISENYKRVFEDPENDLPLAYKRAQLLADMVSGMTDRFALDFEEELQEFKL